MMMDRALKERIIGATVLVLVVVLVVPVFLDGSDGNRAMITRHQPLPGQTDQETRTVVLERDRSNPVPSNGGSESPPPKPVPQQAVRQQEATPAPVATEPQPTPVQPAPENTVETASASATGMWAVQLGSFENRENAERLAAELLGKGHRAFLSRVMTNDGQRHRVRLAPQEGRPAAEAMVATLKKAGYAGRVVSLP